MATIAEQLELGPDEFAFHFQTDVGVPADALANFLKRASTVARQRGGDLRIVGIREGSLAVVIKAIKKSKVAQGAKKEFLQKPIDTTVKVSGFVAGIVAGIIYAMSPNESGTTPVAKAGAELVETCDVTQISIVTNETTKVVMNQEIASEVRAAERRHVPLLSASGDTAILPKQVVTMIEGARRGDLTGDVRNLDGELHFRPHGYHYWVPLNENPVTSNGVLFSGGRFRVKGHIATLNGQPDRVVVDWAEQIP